MIKYSDLGPDLRMCDVVFAGSHDAGINDGGGLTKAQEDPLYTQALNGSRFFDIRIAAFAEGNAFKLKSFHAADPLQVNSVKKYPLNLPGRGREKKIVQTMSLPVGGSAGQGLYDILTGALNFLRVNDSEFLVLIFSKSTTMDIVVGMVDTVLGDKQYGVPGNLNTKTLRELAGHVICVYTESNDTVQEIDSYRANAHGARNASRRFLHDNLFKTGAGYSDEHNGLQYYGKGGLTDEISMSKDKVNRNAGLQKEKMLAGAAVQGCEKLLGMVYITTTGGATSIKSRDDKLWKDKRINAVLAIWESPELVSNIQDRLPRNVDATNQNAAPVVKRFFPNIVMMDFVTMSRCRAVYDINRQSTGPMGEKAERRLIRGA